MPHTGDYYAPSSMQAGHASIQSKACMTTSVMLQAYFLCSNENSDNNSTIMQYFERQIVLKTLALQAFQEKKVG